MDDFIPQIKINGQQANQNTPDQENVEHGGVKAASIAQKPNWKSRRRLKKRSKQKFRFLSRIKDKSEKENQKDKETYHDNSTNGEKN